MMKRKLLAVILVCTMTSLCACSVNVGTVPQDQTVQEDNTDSDKDSGKKSIKEDQTNLNQEVKDKYKSEEDANKQIPFSYMSHPCEMKDGDNLLATGNYYTFELKEDMKEKYPELDMILEAYNSSSQEYLMDFFKSYKDEILQMQKDMRDDMSYECDTFLHLERSDDKVFSFVEEEYGYYGGAHGGTVYEGYNFDPVTGKEIEFDDVVTDTSDLPDIVMKELLDQNEDLEEYFENDQMGKEELIKGLPDRFANNAQGITWGLTYEGIELFFEDYAMGSYAAGARNVEIEFGDYPNIFTDKYANYEDADDTPDVEKIAVDKGDGATEEIKASDIQSDQNTAGESGTPVGMDKDLQKKMNIFVSNFAEQGFSTFDYGKPDIEQIATFAYRWTRINNPDDVKIEGEYYTLSFDSIKKLADKYLGLKVTEDEMNKHVWNDDETGKFKDGKLYVPAADGETYTTLAVVDSAEDMDGTLRLEFTVYSLDLDTYWENDEIPKKYYSLSGKEAAVHTELESFAKGYAIVKDGDQYKLLHYELY